MNDSEPRVVGLIELEPASIVLPIRDGARRSRSVVAKKNARPKSPALKLFQEADADSNDCSVEIAPLQQVVPQTLSYKVTTDTSVGSSQPAGVIEADLEQLRIDLARELRLLERRIAKLLDEHE